LIIFTVYLPRYDFTGNTELKLSFTKPDLTVVVVDSSDGVVAPAVDLVVEVGGESVTFLSGEYWQYPTPAKD
jgi:hypothetical protein